MVGAVNEHWVDKAEREGRSIIYNTNYIRMSASIILWLNKWKNEMLGYTRSIHEDNIIHQEKNEQVL